MTKVTKWFLIAAVAVVLLLGSAIGVVIGVGFYGWKQAVRDGNETAAASRVVTISVVQIQYYTEHASYGTFDQLVEDRLLDSRFAGSAPIVDGYIYTLKVTLKTAGQKTSFALNADPESMTTGSKHFYIDDVSATIRVNSERPANAGDPPYFR